MTNHRYMVNEVTLYMGLEDKDGTKFEKSLVINYLKNHLKGASIVEMVGLWNGQSESSIKIVVIGEPVEKMQKLAADMAYELGQESILMTIRRIDKIDYIQPSKR